MGATQWVLWGQHPLYAHGVPIRIEGGNLAECRREYCYRERQCGWTRLAILHECETWGQPAHGQPEHTCRVYGPNVQTNAVTN